VHGITDADLRGAAPFAEVLPQLADQLDGAVVTAHNLAFDAAFLAAECERAGHPTPSGPGLCTLALARRVRPGQGAYSLAACSEAAGIELLEAHRALPDARATAQLLGVLLDAVPATRRPWPWRRLRLR
jgi:DNA polymerase III epsilon subunit-like protein